MAKLTTKQELFCKEYIVDLNASQAALRCGYSTKTAAAIGNENLQKPQIKTRIQELMQSRNERVDCDAKYVLNRLKEIDELDILDIMLDDLTGFKRLSEWPKAWRTSIGGIDLMTISGDDNIESVVKKIKWPDKTKNLELIGKHVNVKAWDKEEQAVTVTSNIMPVPVADSVESWEESAKKQQEKALSHG